ncbi:MAG: hypothetical protein NTZ18_02430 [Candidatus Komeilibacteria bacterium]|nr:hypothetical protein [Candidatus Komeilibacteria bacterium]
MLEQLPERKEENPWPKPLDIVKIDSRWAQVASGDSPKTGLQFLDNLETKIIDWDDYLLIEKIDLPIAIFNQIAGEKIGPAEINNVHWGPEQKQHPELREQVNIFGEYTSK